MNMMRSLFITTLLVALLSACGSYQAVTQVDSVGYIQFTGEPSNEQILINGQNVGTLGDSLESFDLNGKTVTRVQVTPGTHEVEVRRDGKTVVKRKIYLSDGNNAEVNLP